MSDYGVSSEGFKRKRLDLLLSEINAEIKSIFGDNFNTSPESPDGQVNGVISESNANLWEIAEESYNAFNPSAATGVSLSNLVQLNGITRSPATSSRANLDITGTAGTTIPAGSLISTSDTGDQFSTETDVILNGGGTGSVFASAVLTGVINGLTGTLTVIDTPITGWDTVTNVADAVLGTNEETDVELRVRREQSVARDAQAIIDAIFAEVRAVSGVTEVTVLENDTNTGPDANGLPAHSVHVIVVGGADADIAEAIFLKKTLGATPFGTTTVAVDDDQGIPHDISFSRPTEIPIYIIVNLTTFTNYPVTGDADIKQAIIDYAEGLLIQGRGFFLGDDVIHSELYTPVNSIQGHTVDSLFIGIAPAPTGVIDLPIAISETATFVIADITVNS